MGVQRERLRQLPQLADELRALGDAVRFVGLWVCESSPLAIEIEASNGASDYGNKFGEPVIQGFTRSFGLRLPDGERREWIKPIMFTGGIGQIDARPRYGSAP